MDILLGDFDIAILVISIFLFSTYKILLICEKVIEVYNKFDELVEKKMTPRKMTEK